MILRRIGLGLLIVAAGSAQVRYREAERLIQSLSRRLSLTLQKATPSQARVADVWLVDSAFIDTFDAAGSGWNPVDLGIFRYYPNNTVQWESLFVRAGSAWQLDTSFQTLPYRTGQWRDLDSVRLGYAPSQNQPSGKQTYTYQDLGGGRVKEEMYDSVRQGNSWVPLEGEGLVGRIEGWTTLNRLLGTENPWVLQQPHMEDFEVLSAFDSLKLYVWDGNQRNWVKVATLRYYYRNRFLDSMHIDLNFDPIVISTGRKYFYDANNRLVRRQDTTELTVFFSNLRGGGTKVYLYDGNATLPFKDSLEARGYDENDQLSEVAVTVRRYTYDSNSGSVAVAQQDTCTGTSCTPRPASRERYVYRRGSAPASLEGSGRVEGAVARFVPSPVRAGERVFVTVEVPQAYRVLSVNGQVVLQGELPAGGGWLTLPSVAGVYILQVGAGQQRLLVLP
ncbi:MAG: hypothetical protein ABDH91_02880 [Bacteroidia bacterium]